MSISVIVTRGYGNGTLSGSIADIVTRGYSIGEEVVLRTRKTIFLTKENKRLYLTKENKNIELKQC